MTHRRAVSVVSAMILLVAANAVLAQRPTKIPRIGFLGLDSAMQAGRVAAFRDGLSELGYVDGKNIIIDYRWAEGNFGRLPELGAELVALKPDVLVTAAPPAILALQRATKTIPIVMAAGSEPVAMGFVESLARPGGNITGIAFQDTDLSAKRIEQLRSAVPKLAKLAVLWNDVEGTMPRRALRNVEAAAHDLGLQMCEARLYVVEGCLMTYSASLEAMFRRSADYVHRILKGADPATLPVEQPREFEFVINLNTAKAMGVPIPTALRMQATEVISTH